MVVNERLYMILGILCVVINPVMTTRTVQYFTNPGLTGKKCPSTEQILSETAHSLLQCTAICQATTGCASAFYNHETGTCYGCYGYYSSYTTTVALDDEPSTTYHFPDLCQTGWARHGFSCYTSPIAGKPWQTGLDECSSLDASLVEISDSEEDTFLSAVLPPGFFWIGMNLLTGDGVWRWAGSNSVVTYTNWGDGQPDSNPEEHCVVYQSPQVKWFDHYCWFAFRFVCEKSLYMCAFGWTRRGNNCYRLSEDQLNWDDALNSCRTQNAYHVEVNDADENTFIQSMNTEGNSLWVGLNDIETESTYRWVGSNASMTYTHWSDGEPSGSTVENCIWMYSNGKWNDVPCGAYTRHYVCEKATELVETKNSG